MTELRKQANRMMFNQVGWQGWRRQDQSDFNMWLGGGRQWTTGLKSKPAALCTRGMGHGAAERPAAGSSSWDTLPRPAAAVPTSPVYCFAVAGQVEEEFMDGEDAVGLGVIGKDGSGRLRAVAAQQRQKLSAKAQKKVGRAGAGPGMRLARGLPLPPGSLALRSCRRPMRAPRAAPLPPDAAARCSTLPCFPPALCAPPCSSS